MNHDPERWAVLGRAIRSDRERQGLTREQLAERVRDRGGQVTGRSITSLESGVVPKQRSKPPKLEPVVAALGWLPGWTDRILAGEDPSTVLHQQEAETPTGSPRSRLLELVPVVYEFSRTAVRLGAPASLRDRFDHLVQELLDSLAATQQPRAPYALAAYRPHAEGEGVPADDEARIEDAIRRNS
ncbi:helix-turn-helix transcriptional regulator [Streptomyces sp. ME02-8801-2C]|uniref:helix-turn-helix transcriptional regulator n=1 Tax=Streptomyces sp. ME02-8801-2C TaxID=3028680 RepID=UPI0029B02504|nr:helix-turn-helix transcriptional regulator [Streptomyces sp. ME02-8801-2C]MDX3455101.1 helix-turn-helix transcriptional regulator [Streptomyces sp. ME02-8801-2C]